MLELLDLAARLLDLRLGLLLAADKGGNLAAPLLDDLRQLAEPLVERLLLLLEGGAHLLFRGQRHPAFGQPGVGGVALLAQAFQLRRQFRHLRLAGLLARFAFPGPGRQPGALLQPFLFLRGQALDLINDRINLLVQQALGILQRVELAFVRGDGDFLGAQLGLRLLQAGLQARSARFAARLCGG